MWDATHAAAFLSSLVASIPHLAKVFPSWANLDPDILISNPYGGGPQIILDVAVTGVNGQSRRSDTETDQPLEFRCNQKKKKYTQVAQHEWRTKLSVGKINQLMGLDPMLLRLVLITFLS